MSQALRVRYSGYCVGYNKISFLLDRSTLCIVLEYLQRLSEDLMLLDCVGCLSRVSHNVGQYPEHFGPLVPKMRQAGKKSVKDAAVLHEPVNKELLG